MFLFQLLAIDERWFNAISMTTQGEAASKTLTSSTATTTTTTKITIRSAPVPLVSHPHQSPLLPRLDDSSDHRKVSLLSQEPHFARHVERLRATMFYVCQGSCLCGTVNNRGKVIYCYGDLVPRHGELFAEGGENSNGPASKDLLAAQLGVGTFGILVVWVM